MKAPVVALSLAIAGGALAQVSPLRNYTPSTITENEAREVWRDMRTDYVNKSQCYNRAQTWVVDTHKKYGFQAKKIFIHYSKKYNDHLSDKWGFHIAPVYNVQGVDMAFDKGFTRSIFTPLTKRMWEEKFLRAGVDKLVEIRKETIAEIKEIEGKLRDLDPYSDFYEYRLKQAQKKLSELRQLLIDYKITNNDLVKQKPIKIEKTKRWISFLREQRDRQSTASYEWKYYNAQLRNHIKLLQNINSDLSYAADITCDKITHIEELDYNLNKSWCYIQETTQYYWGIPQLRLLNYGQTNRKKLPPKSDLPRARREGRNYEVTQFNTGQIWAARKQAFGSAHKEIWKSEFEDEQKQKDLYKFIPKTYKKINRYIRRAGRNFRRIQSKFEDAPWLKREMNAARATYSKLTGLIAKVDQLKAESKQYFNIFTIRAVYQKARIYEKLEKLISKSLTLKEKLKEQRRDFYSKL